MRTILCKTACKSYNIDISEGFDEFYASLRARLYDYQKILIVSDDCISELYLDELMRLAGDCGSAVYSCILKSGEERKNVDSLMHILHRLSELDFSRADLLLAFGGGVVSDIGALAASLYMRGMQLAIIPTSLLGMIDASIGGKAAINTNWGKNLIGSFYHPDFICTNAGFVLSLPYDELQNGIAEIIKYGIIKGRYVTELLKSSIFAARSDEARFITQASSYKVDMPSLSQLIYECARIKCEIVAQDENDKGIRNILNLGHSMAHAIEKKSDYMISHGKAVAVGLMEITKSCILHGICEPQLLNELLDIYQIYMLPTSCIYPVGELLPFMLRDKKKSGESISLICPKAMGNVEIHRIAVSKLSSFWRTD